MAEATATTWRPASRVAMTCAAASRRPCGVARRAPPNFWTMIDIRGACLCSGAGRHAREEVLFRQRLGDLHRVQRRPFPQVVPHRDEEQPGRTEWVGTDPPHVHGAAPGPAAAGWETPPPPGPPPPRRPGSPPECGGPPPAPAVALVPRAPPRCARPAPGRAPSSAGRGSPPP